MKKFSSTILALALVAMVPFAAFAEEVDDERPSDVEAVDGEALDGAAKITWTEATDNVAVTGYQVHYGTSPVEESGDTFDEMEDAGDVTEYTVEGLENDTTYYFSIIAYDAAGNESAFWSPRAEVTPTADASAAEDEEAPTVSSAEAVNKVEVKVEFSEAVVLPEEDPQDAFAIENDETFEPLVVEDAVIDEEDEDGKTVILTTAEQEEGTSYTLTVGIDVTDEAGNPIISGTSDTAIFEGSGEEKTEEEPSPVDAVEVLAAAAIDNTHLSVTFSGPVVLSIDPSEDFSIVAVDDDAVELEVLGVNLGENAEGVEDTVAMITTSAQEDRQYTITVANLTDENGEEVTGETVVRGVAAPIEDPDNGEEPEDTIAPADVAKVLASKMMEAEKYVVKLTWEKVQDANYDAVKQTVYQSSDKGENYSKKADLDPEATEYEVKNLEAGEYWFKLTQTDAAGNESEGSIVKVVLSETGPEMAGLLLLSLAGGRLFRRRK